MLNSQKAAEAAARLHTLLVEGKRLDDAMGDVWFAFSSHDPDVGPALELPDPDPALVAQGERLAAALKARDILHGMDVGPDDILIVADWIATGQCDIALRMSDQSARNYGQANAPSSDAAHWVPPYPTAGGDS